MFSWEVQEILEKYLQEDDWHYSKEVDEDDSSIVTYDMGVALDNKVGNVDMRIVVTDGRVDSMAYFPIRTDKDRVQEVCEFLTRINHEYLVHAVYELDYDKGKIRVIWSHETQGNLVFTEDLAEEMVNLPATRIDDFGDDILEIIFGRISAKEQFAKVKARIEGNPWPVNEEFGQPVTFFINMDEQNKRRKQ